MANFQTERLVIGAMAMAEAREALRLTFEYVNQRTAFGAPLWDKQAIRQRLSKRLAEVEAARQLVHHTAWLDAQGTDCVAQVSMVKALAGDLVNEVLYDCVQFHGGAGFVRETAVGGFFNAVVLRIADLHVRVCEQHGRIDAERMPDQNACIEARIVDTGLRKSRRQRR